MNNTILSDKSRFQNKTDLEIYVKDVLGQEKLTTFIVPDIQKILDNIQETNMKMNTRDAIKDEFEHMINWKRVFEHIWTQIRWLNSYSHINELALRKIMKKFVKNFFAIKDNTVNQKLGDIINSKTFKTPDGKMEPQLQILSDDLLRFYADCFCKGNTSSARQELDS